MTITILFVIVVNRHTAVAAMNNLSNKILLLIFLYAIACKDNSRADIKSVQYERKRMLPLPTPPIPEKELCIKDNTNALVCSNTLAQTKLPICNK